jgi:hypothetical protein
MRALCATTLILAAGLALPAAADTTTTATGAGARVSVVSASNGGTTVIVESDRPCRTENDTTANKRSTGSSSARVDTGPAGGLSGSSSAGPNGVSVNVGGGRASAGGDDGLASANQARGGECVVVIHGPAK